MAIKENWENILEEVSNAAIKSNRRPNEITIIAVSKTHPKELIKEAYELGIKIFGENYAQEFHEKYREFENYKDIEWHFIGHLQTNKVKFVVPYAKIVHSVDSIRLAEEISKHAYKSGITQEIMIQINTSGESSKFGANPDDAILIAEKIQEFPNLKPTGLMTIGSFSNDEKILVQEYDLLKKVQEKINNKLNENIYKNLSMGMSNDFALAIKHGATHIRIGTAIFGNRIYL